MKSDFYKACDLLFKRNGFKIILLIAVSAITNLAAFFVEKILLNVLYQIAWHEMDLYDWLMVFAPIGSVALVLIYLVFEARFLPYKETSIYRLLEERNSSAKRDIFYFIVSVTGIRLIFSFIFTLGSVHYFREYMDSLGGLGLLSNVSYIPAVLILFFINTFTYYWGHRFMHSRFLWPIHQVHHSATHFNVVTPLRNHPLDLSLDMVVQTILGYILGASFPVIVSVLMIGGMYQLAAHSHLKWDLKRWKMGWVTKYIFLASQHHLIHHSDRPENFGKNIGIIQLWDRLFGTYAEPSLNDHFTLGDGSGNPINSEPLTKGIFLTYHRWIKRL